MYFLNKHGLIQILRSVIYLKDVLFIWKEVLCIYSKFAIFETKFTYFNEVFWSPLARHTVLNAQFHKNLILDPPS